MGEKKEKKEVLNIDQRVNRIMGEIDYIKKDKKISFGKGGGYTSTSHDAVTKLIHPLLVKYGINIIPTTKQILQEGNRTRVDLEFRWVNIDNPDDFFVTQASGYGIDHQDKGIGKGWSVAQRYTVLKTLHLETGDKDIEDDDIDHVKDTEEENLRKKEEKLVEEFADEVEEKISKEQKEELMELVDSLGLEISDAIAVVKECGWESSSDIPVSKFEDFKAKLISKGQTVNA